MDRIERPILMSGPMVRAILEDRKTNTRRLDGLEEVNNYHGTFANVARFGPPLGYRGLIPNDHYIATKYKRDYRKNPGLYHWFVGRQADELNVIPVKCSYGKPGDSLWVRETWRTEELESGLDGIRYRADNEFVAIENTKDAANLWLAAARTKKWQPSIFMPRWACRLRLEITGVRVERLQDISEEDAKAEGVSAWHDATNGTVYRPEFQTLWQSINGKRPGCTWQDNPHVWVIQFRRME